MKRLILLTALLSLFSIVSFAQYDSGDVITGMDGAQLINPDPTQVTTISFNTTSMPNNFFRNGPNQEYGRPTKDKFFRIRPQTDYKVIIQNNNQMDTYIWIFTATYTYTYTGINVNIDMIKHGDGDNVITADLTAYQDYYVVVEGLYSNGTINTNFTFELIGDDENSAYDVGSYSQSFDYSSRVNSSFLTDNYGLSTKDIYYKFTISSNMDVIMTHEGSTVPDTHMYLLDSSENEITLNDDYDGEGHCTDTHQSYIREYLTPGTYYVVSEGRYIDGYINTNIKGIRGNTQNSAINAGTYSTNFSYSNTVNTSSGFTNNYSGQSTSDVFYELKLDSTLIVTIKHEGSSVSNTCLHLLNSSGDIIESNDDYSGYGHCSNTTNSFIRRKLSPGTYYIVSEGFDSNGSIKTNISGVTEPIGNIMSDAIQAGTYSTEFNYNYYADLRSYTNDYHGCPTNDIFHKFVLTAPMNVTITHEGSTLSDTYMTLLNSSGSVIAFNNDYNGDGHCIDTLHAFIQKQLAAGTYYVVSEGNITDDYVTVNITGATSNGYDYPVIPNSYSTDSRGVGAYGGAFNISPLGGATYSIPIEAPAGVHGMQPNISIVYNSQSGNGVVGYGASIAGLSCITRGPKNIAQDGTAQGVKNEGDDAFYLDGVRLILTYGIPGQSGAIYRPESDPFTMVRLRGSNSNTTNDMWFELTNKDGVMIYYGNYCGRQTYNVGEKQKIKSWYAEYMEDPFGNNILLYYEQDNNEIYPVSIKYGMNKNSYNPLENYIEFEYSSSRYDYVDYKCDGVNFRMGKMLTKITTRTGDDVYRSYVFNYNNNSDGSYKRFTRLISVTKKNGNGESLPPIEFTWSYIPTTDYTSRNLNVNVDVPYQQISVNDQKFGTADLNGDGIDDLIGYGMKKDYLNHNHIYAYKYLSAEKANGEISFVMNQQNDIQLPWQNLGGDLSQYQELVSNNDYHGTSVLDYDGDGTKEYLISYTYKRKEYTYLSSNPITRNHMDFLLMKNGEHFNLSTIYGSDQTPVFATGDINNDGKSDIVVLESGYVDDSDGWRKVHILSEVIDPSDYEYDEDDPVHINPIANSMCVELFMPNIPLHFFISDMNSDGMQDLFVVHSSGYYIYYNQGGPITKNNMMFSTATGCFSVGSNLKSEYMIVPGDFNGDGLLDILSNAKASNTWKLFFNNGNGGFQCYSASTLSNITKHNYTNKDSERFACNVMDFDGDGSDDVVITKAVYNNDNNKTFNKTYTYWLRSCGTCLSYIHYATSNVEDDALSRRIVAGDFDGDGRLELFNYGNDLAHGINANGSAVYRYYDVAGFSNQTGKITRIVGDYGASIDITYSTLADINVYSNGTNTPYPAPYVREPINVVKSITCNNGAAGISSKSFSYQGLRMHKTGRGFLGFEKTIISDDISGQVVESGINTWHPTFFVPTSTYSIITVENGVEAQNNTVTDYHSVDNSLYYLFADTTTSIDLDGNSVTTTHQYYESNGMLLRESVVYGTGNDMYVIKEYQSYLSKGRRYQPRTETVRAKYPGDEELLVSAKKFVYNNTTGAVEQMVENYTKPLPLTTNYTYTPQGNIASKRMTGTGISNYIQYYLYDNTKRFITREYSNPVSYDKILTYDTWGNKLSETDNTNGSSPITDSYQYDHWGNVIGITKADGSTEKTRMGWSNDPSMRFFILSEGDNKPWVKTWYDNAGREVLIESVGLKDVPVRKTTGYDNMGHVKSVENKEGDNEITQYYSYDSRGRLRNETSTSGTNINYQYGNRTVLITSNNHTTYRRYDALDNLVEVTDPSGTSVEYFYSSNGKILRAEIDGREYTYSYDAMGNEISYSDPDAGLSTYSYDALGRVVTSVDSRGVNYTYNYDFLGRITSKTAGNETVTYTYGTTGNDKLRLIEETMGNWSNKYEYDEIGRISAEEKGGHRMEYVYSDKGVLVRKIWADDGLPERNEDYSYDSYGNNIGISAISGAIQWNQTGYTGKNSNSTIKLHSNSTVFSKTTTLGSNGYLSNETLSRGGTILRNTSYSFDGVTGNLSQRVNNGINESFSYDGSDRLTGMTKNGQQVMSVSFDDNGNILNKTGIGNYYYNENDKPHAVVSVDNSTNLIPGSSQTITYNAWGKVTEVNATIGSDTYRYEITYGPDLQRVLAVLWKNNELLHLVNYGLDYEEKYMNGEVTRYYYVADGDGNSAVYTTNTLTGNKAYCIDQDMLGNIVALYDQYGTKCYGAEFDPWGRRTVMSGSIEYDRGFSGHEHIDEIGLIDMNGRMYDPLLGRFISVDPFIQMPDNPQNYNRYSYCLNNPFKYTDPDGECLHLLIGGLIGGTVNWISNGCKWDSDGAIYFGIGFLSGAVGAGVGAGISSALVGGSFWAGAAGTSSALTAGSSFLNGAAIGGSAGFSSGFIAGTGNGLLSGGKFGESLVNGLREGLIAGTTSALLGGIISGYDAVQDGRRFWDGATVSYEEIYEQNMPIVGQIGKHNCLPASAQSIDNYYGGDMTQEDFRALMGGDPNQDGLLDTGFWDRVSKGYKYKHYGNGELGKSSFREIEMKLQQRYGVAITLNGGSTESHSVVLSGIYRKTITNLRGVTHYAKYNWYNIMDPAKGGGYRMISRSGLRGSNFFYIKL